MNDHFSELLYGQNPERLFVHLKKRYRVFVTVRVGIYEPLVRFLEDLRVALTPEATFFIEGQW